MPTPERIAKIQQVVSRRQRGIVVVLQDIHDPHNAQAIVRSCDTMGIQHVYYIFEKQTGFDPRKVGGKSSSSANKWIDMEKFTSTKECLRQLKNDGYEIISTVLEHPEMESIFKADLTAKKIAIIFGNEHSGVSLAALEMSDRFLTIPMAGMIQSMNVSVSAALCLYEITRQRAKNMKKYLMSTQQQKELIQKFLDKA